MTADDRYGTHCTAFLEICSFDTQSDEDNDTVCPSTPGQLVFAKALAAELKAIGLSHVTLDEHGCIDGHAAGKRGRRPSSRFHFPASIPVLMRPGKTSSLSG